MHRTLVYHGAFLRIAAETLGVVQFKRQMEYIGLGNIGDFDKSAHKKIFEFCGLGVGERRKFFMIDLPFPAEIANYKITSRQQIHDLIKIILSQITLFIERSHG